MNSGIYPELLFKTKLYTGWSFEAPSDCLGRRPREGKRLPTIEFWHREFHGLYNPWRCKESDMTEWLSLSLKELIESFPPKNLDSPICWSVQFSHSVVSDSLWPHELQHARPPSSSPTPGVHPNQCPLSQWCHATISSSVVPFSSCPEFSQHQGLFKWVSSSHQVAKVLELQHQHQSFQWTPRTDFL